MEGTARRGMGGIGAIAAKLKKGGGTLLSAAAALPRGIAILGSMVALLFVAYFVMLDATGPAERGTQTSLDGLTRLAAQTSIRDAVIYDEDARVILNTRAGRTLWVAYPRSDAQTADIISALTESGAKVMVDQQTGKGKIRFVVQFLMPLIILAALFGLLFMLTAGKGGAAEFAAFSRFTKRQGPGPDAQVTFADVAACREAKIELQEVVDYLQSPERFAGLRAKAPKGVLLSGPPGTGKTLLARAVAGEAGVPFFSLSGSEFVESLVGVGAARVRDLFRQARESAPAIIFIDELDAAGRQRGAGMGQGNDEREQTLNQMLVEMDGFSVTSGVVVMGATNRPDILDPALLRPGRFDRNVVVDAPDAEGRTEILVLHASDRPMEEDVDLRRVAKQCPGFTGADLANLVNEAALLAVRAGRERIGMTDMEEAVDRVIAGPERRSHVLTQDERRQVAVHEVGHAVTAKGSGMKVGVQKLSIVARGRSLGHATTYDLSDRLVLSRSDLLRQLVTTMGGVAAEQLILGETSTAVEGDLRQATAISRSMVATYGMGETLGRAAFGQKSGEVFLGRDFTQMQNVSAATMEAVDDEVRALLQAAETHARQIISASLPVVNKLIQLLLDKETLSGPELDAILAGVKPIPHPGSSASNGHVKRSVRVRS